MACCPLCCLATAIGVYVLISTSSSKTLEVSGIAEISLKFCSRSFFNCKRLLDFGGVNVDFLTSGSLVPIPKRPSFKKPPALSKYSSPACESDDPKPG